MPITKKRRMLLRENKAAQRRLKNQICEMKEDLKELEKAKSMI